MPAVIKTKRFGRKTLTLAKPSNRKPPIDKKRFVRGSKQLKQSSEQVPTAYENALHLIVQWVSLFPSTFTKKGDRKRPLKVGIHLDLLNYHQEKGDGIGRPRIKRALALYCRSKEYKRCLVEGAERVDLSGEVVGVVEKQQVPENRR